MINQEEYAARRKRLMQQMGDNSIAIICTKPEYPRSQDCPYRFRPDSNFYYLTGFEEPEAIAVLVPGREDGEYILFNRECDPAKEIWDGHRAGQQGAMQDFKADQSFPIEDLYFILPDLIKNRKSLFYQFGFENSIDEDIIVWRNELRKQLRKGVTIPNELIDVSSLIHEMRAVKSPAEIEILRKAGAINVEAHTRAMKLCAPGMTERQLCSELLYVYGQNNCLDVAYDPIIATGNNACVLHYFAGHSILQDGDLLLNDMGEEYQWYTSDVTRTFPVNGTFSPEQKAVYETVLSVQMAILDIVKPGVKFDFLQKTTLRLITEGLVKLGLLQGDIDQLIEDKAYLAFYPHSISHWLGIDVHDVSDYKIDGQWRDLKAGMVLTVEPGIYIQPNNDQVDAKWRGIGIRIEDDIVVTKTGHENFTAKAPKTVTDIEAVMAS